MCKLELPSIYITKNNRYNAYNISIIFYTFNASLNKNIMRKNIILNPFTHKHAIQLTFFISIILDAILMVGYSYNQKIIANNLEIVFFVFLSNGLLLYLLFRLNFRIMEVHPKQRLWGWVSFWGSFAFAYIYNILFCYLAPYVYPQIASGTTQFSRTVLMTDLIAALIVILTTYLFSSVYENQQNVLKNEKLVAENMRTRYEVLKSQVDPHFLFNSLNTLDGLISMDTEKAHEYVQNLSSVFRYTIGNKEIIQLGEELDFTEAYVSLMKIRYGDSLHVNIQVDNEYKNSYIMPISIQLLVENAIKHNVLSNKQPLVIHIETTSNDTIKIWNMIQPKNTPETGEGIGLSNLAERYNLLFQKEIQISSNAAFCVELPLIKELNADKFPEEIKPGGAFCC
jgi:hypothetical protein